MKEITAESKLVSYCGLYCGACRAYLKGRCLGCASNVKATWCKTRTCCINNKYKTCADCKTYSDPSECKKLNNFIAKAFGLLFNSDRLAGIKRIKNIGREEFAKEMTSLKRVALKKR